MKLISVIVLTVNSTANSVKCHTYTISLLYMFNFVANYRTACLTTSGKDTITPIPDPDVKIGGSS